MTHGVVPGVAVFTLGCRLNQFESDGILNQFVNSGRYRIATLDEEPQIAIINSCTVTDRADSGNRGLVNKIRARSPDTKIVLTGCFAQTDPDTASAMEGVDLVVGNDRKADLLRIVERNLESGEGDAGEISVHTKRDPFGYGHVIPSGHVRAYLKIQDGCDRKCTYCKIPAARGVGISRNSEEIVGEALRLEEEGYREIVLTGVNIGWYRDHETGIRFNDLIEKLINALSETRIRVSSLEPCDVDKRLAELTLHPRFCNFLHIPIQSGSKAILRRMRRTYTPDTFRIRVARVLERNPDIFLGTDVMVGFPGESDQDFQDTVRLCSELPFAKLHIFPFSPRSGTPAAQYGGRPEGVLLRERIGVLEGLNRKNWITYSSRFLNTVRMAIVENPKKSDTGHPGRALTDNFLSLSYNSSKSAVKPGDLVPFRLLAPLDSGRVLAEPI
jgi:threonylcarbamoyladenosine tRNA methylthiotransferase MtaB